ncbi:peptidoglycan-binding domain-containing protein [uncultured Cohaesibacter sp.]|uniref:peptidoglycan-binding domain-containing protein n=1 Tax=uncultured Cohaesibacter sp. TaxID=1002546 RepID=UPI0029C75FBF|nr:peptidoglycan-binding domain-containing protein [uncultured Cohaesibacter sp.]
MKKKFIAALMLGFAVTSASGPALAGGGDAVAGALVGGTLGFMLGNATAHPHPVRRPPPPPRYYQTPEAVRYNMDIQHRLNYLGYNAGYVDGVLGRRSRTAISDFQYEAGFPVTGRLTNHQFDVLFSPEFEQAHFDTVEASRQQSSAPVEDNSAVSSSSSQASASDDAAIIEEAIPTSGTSVDAKSQKPLKPLTGANTKLSFAKGEPNFSGISLGVNYDDAARILAENGFGNCAGAGEIVTCSSEQNGVKKSFTIGRSLREEGQPIYLLDSDTELMVDVEKSVIEKKLAEAYPELIAAPNRIISDNANCALKMARITDVETFLERIEEARNNPDAEPSDWLKGAVDTCDVFYKADVAEIDGGFDIRVVMFKSASLQQDFATFEERKLNKVDNALKF